MSKQALNLIDLIKVVRVTVRPIQVVLKQRLFRDKRSSNMQSRLFRGQSLAQRLGKLDVHGIAVPRGEMNCARKKLHEKEDAIDVEWGFWEWQLTQREHYSGLSTQVRLPPVPEA